jgi:hypothetical protein
VEPHAFLTAERADVRQGIDRAGADGSRRANDDRRHISCVSIRFDLAAQRGHVHVQSCIGRDPPDRRRAEAREVGGLLNPRMRFDRRVHAEPAARASGDAVLPYVPAGLGRTRGEEANDVCHVAAADEQPPAIDRVADELGDPSHRLCLDLGRRRREVPGANVRVQRGGEKVAEHTDRGWRRGDVAEEARMRIEERMFE